MTKQNGRRAVADRGSAQFMTRALALLLLVACGDARNSDAGGTPDAGAEPLMPVTIIDDCQPGENRCRAEFLEICVRLETGARWIILQDCRTAELCLSPPESRCAAAP